MRLLAIAALRLNACEFTLQPVSTFLVTSPPLAGLRPFGHLRKGCSQSGVVVLRVRNAPDLQCCHAGTIPYPFRFGHTVQARHLIYHSDRCFKRIERALIVTTALQTIEALRSKKRPAKLWHQFLKRLCAQLTSRVEISCVFQFGATRIND